MVCFMPSAIYIMEGQWDHQSVKVVAHGNIKHCEWSKGGMIMYGTTVAAGNPATRAPEATPCLAPANRGGRPSHTAFLQHQQLSPPCG